ncbi:YeeE/YedE family protein [Guyparkeria hydrothermalis]|uniref:YeeE/YedE family protein n=1 Tax=Guyparkeria hydrothermalis TaxID=923 RepID=UPI00201FF81C|nr:YeeE/YedE family protein [Guyparkeria hydrothermalis]MCL7744092.1 YeeE/YedE family protein [Guyparkeria hydrothermalis]
MTASLLAHPWLMLLAGALVIGLAFGAIAGATRYCNMGAVSDWVLTGDLGRMRAWLLSIAVAVAGVALLEYAGVFDLDQTRVNYRAAYFPWLRYLLGGLLFGIGMVLAGGCTTKTLVNIGQGDMKSLWAYAVVGLTAAGLLYWPEARWFIDQTLAWPGLSLESVSIEHQDVGAVIAGVTGQGTLGDWRLATALFIAAALLLWLWRLDEARRMRRPDLIGGLGIGLVITAGWLWTGSSTGQALMNEASLAFQPPSGTGSQSLSFVAPAAETFRLATNPMLAWLTFGIVAMGGVILGAGLWAVLRRQFRWQGFGSWPQFASYTAGGALMGSGGIIAMGCSVGQGLSGTSTLAFGSLLALGTIVLGAFIALKTLLYRALYPESRPHLTACALLADMRLIPSRCHPFRDEDPSGTRPSGCSR